MIKIESKKNDLGGGMLVQRVLPNVKKRMVGPFCFLDRMGPFTTLEGQNTDVRPHPHIGLSTLTYLFEGSMVHRDSLGTHVKIVPGEVNWMTAGHGISHSERADEIERGHARRLHGLQFWIALPDDKEDTDPSFQHYEANEIPKVENDQWKISLVAGEGFGLKSPVVTSSPLIFADVQVLKNGVFEFAKYNFEIAILVLKGSIKVNNEIIVDNQMITFDLGEELKIEIFEGTHFILIGGQPFTTQRHIWWNLVSSSREKIEAAKIKWKNGTFPMVPGETEFIPAPE